jgi:hypothetical protein
LQLYVFYESGSAHFVRTFSYWKEKERALPILFLMKMYLVMLNKERIKIRYKEKTKINDNSGFITNVSGRLHIFTG